MWHRFSVELAVLTIVSILGVGYSTSSWQSASALSSTNLDMVEVAEDTVSRTYVQPNNRRGTGRRGVLG
jgi:hypothetical protein